MFVALVQIRSKYCEILELVENSVSLVSPLKCRKAPKPLAVPALYLYVCFWSSSLRILYNLIRNGLVLISWHLILCPFMFILLLFRSRVLTICFTFSYSKLALSKIQNLYSHSSWNCANMSETFAFPILSLFVELKYLLYGTRVSCVSK